MTPADLSAASFAGYPPLGRAFAVKHLVLLQRLPLAVCPSFLLQIFKLDTSFPAERALLDWQFQSLERLGPAEFTALVKPLAAIILPADLQAIDWVMAPATFVPELSATLWSSGQVSQFRSATDALFAAVPAEEDTAHRLVFVVLGKGAQVDGKTALRKLAAHGVALNALRCEGAWSEIRDSMQIHGTNSAGPYRSWYVEGGNLHPLLSKSLGQMTAVSYTGLAPLRERVLGRMQATLAKGSGGAEQMRTELAGTTLHEAGAAAVSDDPVLQRFYTELFTESSGPQIFSTSFVQWTGRELARRARPETMLLRYAPRQRHRDLNQMFAEAEAPEMDAQGAYRDAEMGAYYNWLEMRRISAPGKLTFVAWIEDHPIGVVLGPNGVAGSLCSTAMTLTEAMKNFG